MKRHVDALADANDEIRSEQVMSKKTIESSYQHKSALEHNLMVVSSRCLRAESMAASLEAQLRKKALHIDYR